MILGNIHRTILFDSSGTAKIGSGATIEIRNQGIDGAPVASLWKDRAGDAGQDNPFTTASGVVDVWARPGRYRLKATLDGDEAIEEGIIVVPDHSTRGVVTITSTDSPYVVPSHIYAVRIDASDDDVTVQADPADYEDGREMMVVRIDDSENTVTVDATSGKTISDYGQTRTLPQYGVLDLIGNGSDNWAIRSLR